LCKNTPILQKKKAFIILFPLLGILEKTRASIHSIKQFGQEEGLQKKTEKVGYEKSEELLAPNKAVRLVERIEKKEEKEEFQQAAEQEKIGQLVFEAPARPIDQKKDGRGHQNVEQVALGQEVPPRIMSPCPKQQGMDPEQGGHAQDKGKEEQFWQLPRSHFLILFNCCTTKYMEMPTPTTVQMGRKTFWVP